MQTTATFDAIHGLIVKRNALIQDRDAVRIILRGSLNSGTRQEREIELWHLVGRIDGIGAALEALREAGESVASAEWLVIEEARAKRASARAKVESKVGTTCECGAPYDAEFGGYSCAK
jgi:hypothetical protein